MVDAIDRFIASTHRSFAEGIGEAILLMLLRVKIIQVVKFSFS
jgi:hypothetical protein